MRIARGRRVGVGSRSTGHPAAADPRRACLRWPVDAWSLPVVCPRWWRAGTAVFELRPMRRPHVPR